jgi:hypothetical protein
MTIILPASVEILGEDCFGYCKWLISVTFESVSRLKRIEKHAFRETGIIGIIVPRSVKVLAGDCFSFCRSLLTVTIENGSTLRVGKGDSCFGGCFRLQTVTFQTKSSSHETDRNALSRMPVPPPIRRGFGRRHPR